MLLIKFYLRPGSPTFGELVRTQSDPAHKLCGLVLVNFPTSAPYRKREARWINPREIHIEWIRKFKDEYESQHQSDCPGETDARG